MLTGIRPSGDVHVGNFLGMIRPALKRQQQHGCFFFIADLHSLTTLRNAEQRRSFVLDTTATWLALGLDPQTSVLYRQSDIPEVTELAWYLSCVTGVGFLEKAHAYKDAAAKGADTNHGVFAYPVLMAADILLYDANLVPVGKDQKQHVEMARDMAGSLNAVYGECLVLPRAVIDEDVMVIPGLDGRKMSKSYDNTIPLFCDESLLRKKIMGIVTDSTPLEAPKELEGSLLGELCKHFATAEQYTRLKERLLAGGLGWGHAKAQVFEIINSYIYEPRERYRAIRADEKRLEEILAAGATRAREVADRVITRVRNAVGTR